MLLVGEFFVSTAGARERTRGCSPRAYVRLVSQLKAEHLGTLSWGHRLLFGVFARVCPARDLRGRLISQVSVGRPEPLSPVGFGRGWSSSVRYLVCGFRNRRG